MLIGLTPLLRGFLAHATSSSQWLARNRFNQLLAALYRLFFAVAGLHLYLASLVFYDYEMLVNPTPDTTTAMRSGGPG